MPLRLVVTGAMFSLQLGFFYPPDSKAHCDKIKIAGDSHQVYEYSFERIERIGTTYLSVGSIPSQIYCVEYINANPELRRFWSNNIPGINQAGSFFDGRTGQILQSGGKAYAGNFYYLLQRHPIYTFPADIEAIEIAKTRANSFNSWYLYKIRIKRFSEHSAKFFLKYAIFLTEKPTKFYPIWPAYIQDPYFIYHNSAEFYFYLCGDDAELKSYPATANVLGTQDGKLYKLYTREREQLISLGKSGALGFSYLVKQPLRKKAPLPAIIISDHSGNTLNEESYAKLPKLKCISVSCPYDGKAVVQRNGSLSSGAGYAVSIESSIRQLLTKTRELLEGCTCDSACHRCLKHYRNQYIHSVLNRKAALDLLNWGETGARVSAVPYEKQQYLLKSLEQILRISGIHIDVNHESVWAEGRYSKKKVVVYPAMWTKPIEENTIFVSDAHLKYAKPYALKTILDSL